MDYAARHSSLQTLAVILSVHVAAFVIFHLCHALVFDIRFVRLQLEHRWIGDIIVTTSQTIRYLPSLLFLWMIFKTPHHRGLLALMALVALYSGHYYSYPLLTGFLYSIDQIDWYPTFLFDRMPGIAEYPPL